MRYLLFLFLLLASCLAALADSPAAASSKARVIVPLGDSPSRGAADAPVVMIEFIDFQ